MERFTHLGRPIDPRYPSNLFALAATAVMAGLTFVIAGLEGSDARGGAIAVGLSTFLAWALGRELDPDRPLTANIAAIVGGLVAFASPTAIPGALYLILVATRITVRTTGLAPKWTDLAVHAVIAGFLARTTVGCIAAMALAVAIARDAMLPRPAPRSFLWWALAVAGAATVAVTLGDGIGNWETPTSTAGAIAVVGLLGAVALQRRESPHSTGDLTDEPLEPRRLRAGRLLASATAAATAIITGGLGILALAPVWTTLISGGVVRWTTRRR